jgi:acyl-CoA thioester hydrolase
VFVHLWDLRVRYAETDQMGFVYYGAYAAFFEVARVEALRSLGVTYKSMENSGILMPVLNFSVRYFKPGQYDDLLKIETTITQLPGVRIRFEYQTFNERKELLNEASTELVFLNSKTMKPIKAPAMLIESLKPYFS